MKKALKKIAAVAMAFTLLGTGTAIKNTVAPEKDNILTVSAACNHVVGQSSYSWSGWHNDGYEFKNGYCYCYSSRTSPVNCIKCGNKLYDVTEHKTTSFKW